MFYCPSCGGDQYSKNGTSRGQRFICKDCNREFSEVTALYKEQMTYTEGKDLASGTIVTAMKPSTLIDAAKLFKVDLNIWEAERMKINSWDMPAQNGTLNTCYQVTVWFKKKTTEGIDIKALAKQFHDSVRDYRSPVRAANVYKENKAGRLLEINSADLHLGKLAWGMESGENFDINIAVERFMESIEDLLNNADPYGYSRILFVVGNDFFNADTPKDTTTFGTQVDSDVRWQKRTMIGNQCLVNAIDMLREVAPVHVKVICGNHDWVTMFTSGEYLKAWFKKDKNVTIDNAPKARKYFVWKSLLLGFTHGHKEKPVDLFAIMATEMREAWANAKFKEFHIAHLHHERSHDYKGLVVRWMKSLTGTDSWHYNKGYIGSVQGAEAFVYDEETGLVAHLHSNLRIE